jgi:hypothetical protein
MRRPFPPQRANSILTVAANSILAVAEDNREIIVIMRA